jgi:hypothetical protein
MYRVTTPVPGFTGTSAGVNFTDGAAEVGEGPALAYFRAAGYGIEDLAEPEPEPEPEPTADPAAQPRKSASTEAWRTWAVDHGGLSADEANELSRDQLVERFATEEN